MTRTRLPLLSTTTEKASHKAVCQECKYIVLNNDNPTDGEIAYLAESNCRRERAAFPLRPFEIPTLGRWHAMTKSHVVRVYEETIDVLIPIKERKE